MFKTTANRRTNGRFIAVCVRLYTSKHEHNQAGYNVRAGGNNTIVCGGGRGKSRNVALRLACAHTNLQGDDLGAFADD